MKTIGLLTISILYLFPSAFAEVMIEDRVNSWDSIGFLWVVIAFSIVVLIVVLCTWLDNTK